MFHICISNIQVLFPTMLLALLLFKISILVCKSISQNRINTCPEATKIVKGIIFFYMLPNIAISYVVTSVVVATLTAI